MPARHTIAAMALTAPLTRKTARQPNRSITGAISNGASAAPRAAVAM